MLFKNADVGAVEVVPRGEASLIACYVPDLEQDIRVPLRAAGYADAAIRALGQVEG